MPRFRQVSDILRLMSNKELIRNLGIIAHIDHGKTTLTDSLLAGTGLLSPKMVGSARVLDYLKEEQRRGITIKTANISLLHQTVDKSYIINLVDTPGHVDFTGRVTRALRSIDGAVVVVDAVEEIMAQTEIVVKQALEERVRPILFINKTDKLMTELKLNTTQIERKLNKIIDNFNDLIELYGEMQFKKEWKVNPEKGSVVIGSALHRWGFTLAEAKQKGVKFSHIIRAYQEGEIEKLPKSIPLHKSILDAAIAKIPSPIKAQKYRIERIWKGDVASDIGQSMANCDDNGPLVMNITNVQADMDGSIIATGRVFSGNVTRGQQVILMNAYEETTINQVSLYMGAFRELVDHVGAGNLAALSGPNKAHAGETLVTTENYPGMVPFERISYVSEPVLTVTIEPTNPQNIPVLLNAITKLVTEDPNLNTSTNQETGEYTLSGMGELHLQTAIQHLQDFLSGTEIHTSLPRVVYKETVTDKGKVATAKSPNKKNKFSVQVEPFSDALAKLVGKGQTEIKEIGNLLVKDENNNGLVDTSRKMEKAHDVLDSILSGFKYACEAGPLCREPLRAVKVNIVDAELSRDYEQKAQAEIAHAISKAIFGSFLTAKPRLQEPIYKTIITTPTELSGDCSRIINSRRGKVTFFEQKEALAVITCLIPVAETFGLSQELRSTTSGRAFWQSAFYGWEKVPEKTEAKIITEIRERKGLTAQIPQSVQFMEEGK
jgi:elongation factor 2